MQFINVGYTWKRQYKDTEILDFLKIRILKTKRERKGGSQFINSERHQL